jgi:hypothetical protein
MHYLVYVYSRTVNGSESQTAQRAGRFAVTENSLVSPRGRFSWLPLSGYYNGILWQINIFARRGAALVSARAEFAEVGSVRRIAAPRVSAFRVERRADALAKRRGGLVL